MKFIVMGLYPCSYVLLDNTILTLSNCIVRGRELQSSGHAFLLLAPNHTANLQHIKSQTSSSEVKALGVQGKEPTVTSDYSRKLQRKKQISAVP